MNKDDVNKLISRSDIYIPELVDIWKDEEDQQPIYIRDVNFLEWDIFADKIFNRDLIFYRNIVKNLVAGDVYVLKNAVSPRHMKKIKNTCMDFAEKNTSSHFKILDNTPDFFRTADIEVAKKYGFYRCNTLFHFHRWNNSELFKVADLTWDILKMASGINKEAFKKMIPSNGLVDRLHIHLYPPDIGEQEKHQDPFIIQKIVMGHALSNRGVDYKSGGIYFINKNQEEVDVDSLLNGGDCYICFPSLVHGVKKIKGLDNASSNQLQFDGRWFMGFYTLWSDVNTIRYTGTPWINS